MRRKPKMAEGNAPNTPFRSAVVTIVLLIMATFSPAAMANGNVQPRFDLTDPSGGPFPSDRFTLPDATQLTGLRVNLPKPDCAARRSDCEDIEVLNTLDGFNLQPRMSVPFTGPIDPASVSSDTVFLFKLSCTSCPGGNFVGINQTVWDPETNMLHVESDQLLDQDARYLLVVTNGIRNPDGERIDADQFRDVLHAGQTNDLAEAAYRQQLLAALDRLKAAGVSTGRVAAASIFTTQSITALLEKIRDQIKAATPEPADFLLGLDGSRTVFSRSSVASVRFNRQVNADPAEPLSSVSLPLSVLDVVPGAIGTIAFGRYSSPDYQVHPGEFIPPVGTLSGTPLANGTNGITFVLFLPSSAEPSGGYPVAIWGHGAGSNKTSSGILAAKLAQEGIATIAIDAPGAGFGPSSTYTVTRTDSTSVTFLTGGRSIDQNRDGAISEGEGFDAAPPRRIQGGRDGQRQNAVDHMQLVREIEVGMDVDGDGMPDLDPSRIYYGGQSRGGNQGLPFLAVEPSVRAGVFNVPGGSGELSRLSVASRGSLGMALASRGPSLVNSPGITSIGELSVAAPFFNESMPLRDGTPLRVGLEDGSFTDLRSPLTNTVPGAMEIQQVIDNAEWALQAGDPVAYASHIRENPLDGVPAKSVIIQFANGDRYVPNPTTTAILRAGDLADRATFVRTNLVFLRNPTFADPNLYPHVFLLNPNVMNTNLRAISLKAQQQIATFFASNGTEVIDPDDVPPALSVPIFEVPIAPPLPETTNYFP